MFPLPCFKIWTNGVFEAMTMMRGGGGGIAAKLHISLSDEQESSLNGFEIEICQHPPEAGICAGGGDQIGGLF